MRETASWGVPGGGRPADWRASLRTVVLPSSETSDAVEAMPEVVADRYQLGEILGRGGAGTVVRAHDTLLNRSVALKVLHRRLLPHGGAQRFLLEAQTAAGLQHPGIAPIYDLGHLPDGRPWFTQRVVDGQTLEAVFQAVHRDWRLGRSDATSRYRRLLEDFQRLVGAVAFAHSRSVVHRDLKPTNLMVGAFGEALVVDWGLSRPVSEEPDARGTIVGTPAYMAPEQARGEACADPRIDVYALGATLYDLLVERPPRIESSVPEQLRVVAAATAFHPPSHWATGVPVDPEVERICLRALATDPRERHPSAAELATELGMWLDGARRREQAMGLVSSANEALALSLQQDQHAASLQRQAGDGLAALPVNAPVASKSVFWELQDAAAVAKADGEHMRAEGLQQLRSALTYVSDLAEAHSALAAEHHRVHRLFEAHGRHSRAAVAAREIAIHDRGKRFAAYLRGTGAVTLLTDPPGAEVRLHRFEARQRRLRPVFERVLGTTPLVEEPLAMGNYLLTLHVPGHVAVRYPVQIGRQAHWSGVPPEGEEPVAIDLPRVGELGADDCYVPAGWAWMGDDQASYALPRQRHWISAFVVRRYPVTCGEYVAFLEDLRRTEGEAVASALEPVMGEGGEPFFSRDPSGAFLGIRTDKTGADWDRVPTGPRVPALYVDVPRATRFAAWASQRSGQPWRLGHELEWQKAARGVDGRMLPWGDHFDPTWCRVRDTAEHVHFVEVDAMPSDRSLYGVVGLAGNVTDWGRALGGGWVRLGGFCNAGMMAAGACKRTVTPEHFLSANTGFRLFRDVA